MMWPRERTGIRRSMVKSKCFFSFLPSATVVVERKCFHKHLSGHRGMYTPWADTPLDRHHPPEQTPLGRHYPLRQKSPQVDIPSGRPDRQKPPPRADDTSSSPPPDSHCSGRYVSHWNAFLCSVYLTTYIRVQPRITSSILLIIFMGQEPVEAN